MNFTVEVPDNLIEKLVRDTVDTAFGPESWGAQAGAGRAAIRRQVEEHVKNMDFSAAIETSLRGIAAERIVDEAVDEFLRKAVKARLKQMRAEDMLPGVERVS